MCRPKLVLIGSSTGGPKQLKSILCDVELPLNSSIVVAQHMRPFYLQSFADQFNKDVKSEVVLLSERTLLQNKIYILAQNSVMLPLQNISAKPDDSGIETIFNPNVDMLFDSAVPLCKFADVMAVLMTGIGDDGATALSTLYSAGAHCIAESETDCIVYGMPKKAKETNKDLRMATLKEIKYEIERFINDTNKNSWNSNASIAGIY